MQKRQPKILIAEDERPSAQAMKLKLEHSGFSVTVVGDGEEAIASLEKNKYDALILDLMLPKKDGFGVLAMMKGRKISVPVIVLSNLGQPEDIKRVMALGARQFFVKTETSMSTVVDFIKKEMKT
jgi:DNA-binding response OmpR family regulator